ncbi:MULTISPECIES: hypothetical protein [Staphylococcus]|uniref:hypothetical protein n=1 Tax=Staphylococcus TaxID=1279 RepID=UPI0015E5B607|nr:MULTISPECIES: hypothetical protein [Staphylococcus]MBA1354657.1 hypothetical protein [Staphylococcus cohnii]MBA1390817.1 hypothetical protein [Staphylococcus cohnii]
MNNINQPEHFETLSQVKQNALLEFCYAMNKIKSFNTRHSSYGLKHVFERRYREALSGTFEGSYITNGQFKGAMLKAGFEVKDKAQLNWCFNVSEKSIKSLDER